MPLIHDAGGGEVTPFSRFGDETRLVHLNGFSVVDTNNYPVAGGTAVAITMPASAAAIKISSTSINDSGVGDRATGTITVVDWQEFAAVAATGTYTVDDYASLPAAAATGTFTVTDYASLNAASATGTVEVLQYANLAGETVTIGATVLTEGVEWTASVDNTTTAVSLAAAIDALADVTATNVLGVITVTAAAAGAAGNSIGMATNSDPADLTVSGATLTGGDDAETADVSATLFIAGTDFTAETSNDVTATNLAAAIDAMATVTATATTNVVTVTAATAGAAGNGISLATSDAVALEISGANLTGGDDAETVTVDGNVLTANVDFTAETSNDVTADNLKTAIHALATVNATVSTNVVTVSAATAGTAGNSIALLTSDATAIVRSGATLTGGEDVVSLEVDGQTLTAGVDFTAETGNTETAANIATAIDLTAAAVSASAALAVVTLTADEFGTPGNSVTISTTETDAATVSGATLSGGGTTETGAFTVQVTGLDTNGAALQETVTLEGTNAVNTAGSFLRVNKLEVLTAGSGGTNAGIVYAGTGAVTSGTPATKYAFIAIGLNLTNTAVYTVPADKKLLISKIHLHPLTNQVLGTGTTTTVELDIHAVGGLKKVINKWVVMEGDVVHDFDPVLIVDEQSDVIVRAAKGATTMNLTVQIDGILIDKN